MCVMDPAGRRLKIPVWMLSQDCAATKITERPHLTKGALLSLASLVTSQLNSKGDIHGNPVRFSPEIGASAKDRNVKSVRGLLLVSMRERWPSAARTACLVRDLKPIIPRPLIHACLAILKSLRSASPVAALSVQSTSTEHPFLVVCGPCCLPALT